jgi:hypothetical protein
MFRQRSRFRHRKTGVRGAATRAELMLGLACAVLLAGACGGSAEDGQDGDLAPQASTAIAPRPAQPALAPQNEPAPEPIDDASSAPSGMPSDVARLASDPPEAIDTEQFDALLGYYCGDCHETPACAAACDGLWFDDWEHLAGGGNIGPSSADRLLERVVDTLSNGRMPPDGSLIAHPMPDTSRQLMIEFIERAQNGTP